MIVSKIRSCVNRRALPLIGIFAFLSAAAAVEVSDIVEGTDPACPNRNNPGVKSYVFEAAGIRRCFNVYRPEPADGAEDVPQPVLLMAHGSGSNANLWCGKPHVRASFAALNTTLLCTSSAIIDDHKTWRPPKEGSSATNPYPCSEEDSVDLPYYERILDWIDGRPADYDRERVFNGGFSQGSNFISYVSFCFPGRLRGMATSGSGLKVNGAAVEYCSEYDNPSRGGVCEIGVADGWKNTGNTGTCEGCLFTPMRPLDGATDVTGRPLRACINVGELDSRVHGSDQYRYYFERAGLRTNFTIWPGVRHAMPPDWPKVYDECLGITASANPSTPTPTSSPTLCGEEHEEDSKGKSCKSVHCGKLGGQCMDKKKCKRLLKQDKYADYMCLGNKVCASRKCLCLIPMQCPDRED